MIIYSLASACTHYYNNTYNNDIQCRLSYNSPAWRPVALPLLKDSKLRSLNVQKITSENAFPKRGPYKWLFPNASFRYVWNYIVQSIRSTRLQVFYNWFYGAAWAWADDFSRCKGMRFFLHDKEKKEKNVIFVKKKVFPFRFRKISRLLGADQEVTKK